MSASNTRRAYQLKGHGSSVNGWPFKAYSRDIFVTREDAANHIPEFTRRCTSPDYNPVEHAFEEDFAVSIIELDLNG